MAEPQPPWLTDDAQATIADTIHVERVVDAFTGAEVIGMLRHPGAAYVETVADPAGAEDHVWWSLGLRYLDAVARVLGLAPGDGRWLSLPVWRRLVDSAAGVQPPPGLAWLPVRWGRLAAGAAEPDPTGSFWVARPGAGAAGDGSRDGTLVLLAGCMRYQLQLGSDMGLRIAMHVAGQQVRILGVTLSGLAGDHALHSAPDAAQSWPSLWALLRQLRPVIGHALGDGRRVWLRGLERARTPGAPVQRLLASGHLLRPTLRPAGGLPPGAAPGRARVHDFSVEVDLLPGADPVVVAVRRNEFAGSAAVDVPRTPQPDSDSAYVQVQAFLADGASQGSAETLVARRITRGEAALQPLRTPLQLHLHAGTLVHALGAQTLFETRGARSRPSDLSAATLQVTDHAVVRITTPPATAEPLASTAFWTDEQASVEAHVRAAELFDRMGAYGLDPVASFRFARLPLVQRARAAAPWAPDGDVPYAEVRPFLGDDQAEVPDETGMAPPDPEPASRLQLLVKYGSADPMHRRKQVLAGELPDDPLARNRAQYLGVASDPRWAWHEFGHVLNFASTGELEFPFAHSAGDALGAIAQDPLSGLATGDEPEHPLRFASFPWIEVPGRSHGRPALQGYCWCGARNRVRLDFQVPLERHHHGYVEEQMLSSSLFRLYRSLGGDTRAPTGVGDVALAATDQLQRLAAADHCMLLVMRAIALLGPDSVAPARTPDQFVSALIDADTGTGDWQISTHWPLQAGQRQVARQGGLVHKTIRWAFERQGLYATDDPTRVAEGPGLAPRVDVYIADRRPAGGVDSAPGGYAPVPLRCGASAPWHADPAALVVLGGRRVQVQLGNRGSVAATGVRLRLWWGSDGRKGQLQWQAAPPAEVAVDVPGGSSAVLLDLPAEVPADVRWLLASADVAADPSNLAPGASPPADSAALMHLVAHDNNLALWPLAQPGPLDTAAQHHP